MGQETLILEKKIIQIFYYIIISIKSTKNDFDFETHI